MKSRFTGASPKNLSIFESAEDEVKDKVNTFRTKDDFLDLKESLSDSNCKDIVIIGGGFLGSELACALAKSCMYISFICRVLYITYKIPVYL
jgi:programmed cell death 8 (apoptosis-inducing factor)